MLSLTTATNTRIPNPRRQSPPRLSYPLVSSLNFEFDFKKRGGNSKKFGFLRFRVTKRNIDCTWCCWCKEAGGDGDVELEAEIMGFMAKSEKPTMFPTRKELIRRGRVDLVEAIEKRGGWYSLGWDDGNVGVDVEETNEFDVDIGEFHRRVESCKESASLREHHGDFDSSDVNLSSGDLDSLQLNASEALGGSLEIGADEDSGIEGILSRLEKQRNSDFGLNLGENGYVAHARSKDGGDGMDFDTSLGVARTDLEVNDKLFHQKGILNTSGGKISRNSELETWRTWSNQRAGSQHTEFEAAEISFSKDLVETDKESYQDEVSVSTEEYADAWYKYEEINHNQIRTRLQHLECELTTALRSLRSKREECISEEGTASSSDLQKLSDAWEFQENEFMSAKGKLRSIRAKLAVLEGKMALAIIDAQKLVEVKQKRIDGARKALQLLRTTCIVWPNSASEVLLVGSFDGWTSQRKMEKSRTGIFSVCLKLYPGKYEIKFIVDGIWKVDPLRPIVKNNGYENNLLIVS